jgi:hypothetical protein
LRAVQLIHQSDCSPRAIASDGPSERLGAAIVLVSHLTKDGSANGKRRVLGSIGYVGACRANYLFATDPEDRNEGIATPVVCYLNVYNGLP